MELQSFAIGIVTMVVFALAVVTIIGILKVTRMATDLLALKRRLDDSERELSRDINMVDATLMNQLNHTERNLNDTIDATQRQLVSYTDKRIDKLIDTYFEHVGSKKQILKD